MEKKIRDFMDKFPYAVPIKQLQEKPDEYKVWCEIKKQLIAAKLVKKVTGNLYIINEAKYDEPILSRYAIASLLSPHAFITDHSALEFYGLANQYFNVITIGDQNKWKSFGFNGEYYQHKTSHVDMGIHFDNSLQTRVTTLERTLIDCIAHMGTYGELLEETLRAIDIYPKISEELVLQVLHAYNSSALYAKAGYILHAFKEELQLSKEFFEICKSHISFHPIYLYRGHQGMHLDPEWNLYTPGRVKDLIDKGLNYYEID